MSVIVGSTTTLPAHANGEILRNVDQVARDLDSAAASQPTVHQDTALVPEGLVTVDAGVVSAPAAGEDFIELSLPSDKIDEIGRTSFGVFGTTSAIVKDEGDGAFRVLLHIPTLQAKQTYSFKVDNTLRLVPLEDGGVTVRTRGGDVAGVFAPPWARDASGAPVRTTFVVDGNTLVQRIHPTAATVFPVVADPFWIPVIAVFANFTRHALAQAAARGISQALIKQVVRNGTRTAGSKGTSIFTQGSGKNRIRVIVDNNTGNIFTVTKG